MRYSKKPKKNTPYTSSLSDKEWLRLEPLLLTYLPKKKKTCPLKWGYRDIINGILYQLKNGCNWADLPKDFPPYSTVYWHYKQWKECYLINQLLEDLHGDIREQIKKKKMDALDNG